MCPAQARRSGGTGRSQTDEGGKCCGRAHEGGGIKRIPSVPSTAWPGLYELNLNRAVQSAVAFAHTSVYLIGMYTDENAPAPPCANKWLTSVVFDMRSPVLSAIRAATGGGLAGGLYAGAIANAGVSPASCHRLAHLVPRALIAKLRTLPTGLSQGWVSTNPAVYVPAGKETGNGNG